MTYQLYFHIWNPKNYFPILAIISFLLLTLKPRDFIHQFPSLAHNPPFLRWIGPRAVICYRYNTGVDPLMWWEVGTQQRLLCLKQHRITSRGGPTWSLGCPMVPPTFIFIPIYIYISFTDCNCTAVGTSGWNFGLSLGRCVFESFLGHISYSNFFQFFSFVNTTLFLQNIYVLSTLFFFIK